ncbi:MAG: hypothetical protein IIV99_06000, partial [Oscillospiraceae bacterium]|nr:hypothetical protein [Oscillospiraceae bacterium]
EYAEKLLTRTNPYTGLAYKDDPQMAMIGITNESGLVSMMHIPGLYPTTEYYQKTTPKITIQKPRVILTIKTMLKMIQKSQKQHPSRLINLQQNRLQNRQQPLLQHRNQHQNSPQRFRQTSCAQCG